MYGKSRYSTAIALGDKSPQRTRIKDIFNFSRDNYWHARLRVPSLFTGLIRGARACTLSLNRSHAPLLPSSDCRRTASGPYAPMVRVLSRSTDDSIFRYVLPICDAVPHLRITRNRANPPPPLLRCPELAAVALPVPYTPKEQFCAF
jgi:hypothetical protein